MDPTRQLFYLSAHNRATWSGHGRAIGFNQKYGAPIAMPIKVTHGDPSKITASQIQIVDILNYYNWTNSPVGKRAGNFRQSPSTPIGVDGAPNPSQETFGWHAGARDRGVGAGQLHNFAGIPAVILSEYRPLFSSTLANARYQLNAAMDGVKQGGAALKNVIDTAVSGIPIISTLMGAATQVGEWATDFGAGAGKFGASLATAPKGFRASGQERFDETTGLDNSNQIEPHLKAYAELYPAAVSGFKYIFPYLNSQQYKSTSSQWEDRGVDAISDIFSAIGSLPGLGSIGSAGGNIGKMFDAGVTIGRESQNMLEPAGYIDQNKQYTGYGKGGKAKTFKFLLSNTRHYEEVIQNWHLIFLLTYQNLPNKTTKIALEPPALYEVEVPGHYYCPFAFVSDLKVTALGTTRTIAIPLRVGAPAGVQGQLDTGGRGRQNPAQLDQVSVAHIQHGQTHSTDDIEQTTQVQKIGSMSYPEFIDAVIPEAYEVEITLQPLLTDTKNFENQALRQSKTLYTASVEFASDKKLVQPGTVYTGSQRDRRANPNQKNSS